MTETNQDPRQRIMKKNIKSLSKNSLPYYKRFSLYSFIQLLIYFNIFSVSASRLVGCQKCKQHPYPLLCLISFYAWIVSGKIYYF